MLEAKIPSTSPRPFDEELLELLNYEPMASAAQRISDALRCDGEAKIRWHLKNAIPNRLSYMRSGNDEYLTRDSVDRYIARMQAAAERRKGWC